MSDAALEHRIEVFVSKYTPEIAAQLRDARQRLRARFPHGVEMVFDNTNALVFGIGPNDRSRESFISIAAYPRWLTLFFLNGAGLADPEGLLVGDGKQVRGIRLKAAADIDAPAAAAPSGRRRRGEEVEGLTIRPCLRQTTTPPTACRPPATTSRPRSAPTATWWASPPRPRA
jgi:hypothetical protein